MTQIIQGIADFGLAFEAAYGTWVAPTKFNEEYTRLIGTKAGIDFNTGTFSYRKELNKPDRIGHSHQGNIDSTLLALQAFVDSVRTRKPPVATVEHGRDSVLACTLVREAVYQGQIVTLEMLPLLRTVRARHPGILLYLNETYGNTLSELVMNGRMDMAVLYGGQTAVHGLAFVPLLKEQLFLVGSDQMVAPPEQVPLRMIGELELFLPRPYNVVRRMVNEAFAAAGMTPRVVAEIESASTLTAAIADGLGATILPESMAREVAASCNAWQSRITDPVIEAPLALCQSDHLPLSEPAQAIRDILLELIAALHGSEIASG